MAGWLRALIPQIIMGVPRKHVVPFWKHKRNRRLPNKHLEQVKGFDRGVCLAQGLL